MADSEAIDGDHCTRPGSKRVTRSTSRNTSLQSSQEDLLEAVKPNESKELSDTAIECAVCLQTCIHPVKLPCTHIFCYLCVKGVAFQSRRCAMCRQEIPTDFLLHPQLLDRTQLEKESSLEDGYQWFYEGRNGWWQYDERTSVELESAYKRSQRVCELLIAGFLYTIDFDQMLQYRKTEPSRRRRIKRDLASIPKKGVAGLRLEQNDDHTSSDLLSVVAIRAANCQTPQTPSNTPQTPQTPPEPTTNEERWQERERRRLRRAVEEIERLRLHDGDNMSRLDDMVIYYNLDEENTQDLCPSEDDASDEEEEIIN